MRTKLVVRILDATGAMLGWQEAEGVARGDGFIHVERPTIVPIDVTGDPALVSVHWCDVNVETRAAIEQKDCHVAANDTFAIPGNWNALCIGPCAGGLPPTATRQSVSVTPPAGTLGATVH